MICQLIHNDIKDADEKATFKTSTFTPIASERVRINKSNEHTRDTILRGGDPEGIYSIELSKEKSDVKSKPKKSGTISWRNLERVKREAVKRMDANRLSEFVYRWHYRIVYKEYAVPFYELRTVDDMLLVLEHSVEGKLITSTSTIKDYLTIV